MSAISSLKASALGVLDNRAGQISIYPNPSNGLVFIETVGNELYEITISDANGSVVVTSRATGKTSLDLNHLNKGIYTVKAVNGNQVIIQKLLIE